MAAPIQLRLDFNATLLRNLARGSRDPDQIRRLLALAEIYDGGSRSDAARIGGVGLQIVRDWVLWFNAEGPNGLVNGKVLGAPSLLDDRQREALRQAVQDGPIPPFMVSCAGVSSIWRNGCLRSSGSRSQSRR